MSVKRIELADGKYAIQWDTDKGVIVGQALRYGIPWRDIIGDGLILSLLHRIFDLEDQVQSERYDRPRTDEHGCYTLPDGSCRGCPHCMHAPTNIIDPNA